MNRQGSFDEFDELLDEALAQDGSKLSLDDKAPSLRVSFPQTPVTATESVPSEASSPPVSSTFFASTFPAPGAVPGPLLDPVQLAVLGESLDSALGPPAAFTAPSPAQSGATGAAGELLGADDMGSLKHIPAIFQPDPEGLEEYTYEQIEEATQRFNQRLMLGQGGFGKVYKGMLPWKEDGSREGAGWRQVAIKTMTQDGFDQANSFHTELKILGGIRHPYIVQLLGFSLEKMMTLVYEFVEHGSLEDVIIRSTPRLSWQNRVRVLYETAAALSFLHNLKPEPIMHRDLKPANILLDEHFRAKLADVGLSRAAPELAQDNSQHQTHIQDTTILGTLGYIDPMYLSSGKFRPASDVYSLGVTILQLVTGYETPKGMLDQVDMAVESRALMQIVDHKAGDWPQHVVEDLVQLAMRCVERRPSDRPDLVTIVCPMLKSKFV